MAGAYKAENAPGAERATAMLMKQDASNYRRYLEVAMLYLKLGDEDEAARILGGIIEQMLAGREESDLLELVNELLLRNPEHVPSLRLLARIHWWQRDMDKLRAALERLAESAEAAGLAEDERYALTQLVRLAPDEQRYENRLNELGGVLEESLDGSQMADEAAIASVPSFEGFNIVETEAQIVEPAESGSEFEWNSVAEQPVPRSDMSFADLNEAEESPAGVMLDPLLADPFAGPEAADETAQTEAERPIAPGAGKAASPEHMMRQELESVDFYITQGYSDIAADTLQLLENQFGRHPEIDLRLDRLKASNQGVDSGSASERVEAGAPAEAQIGSNAEMTFGEIEIGEVAQSPVVSRTPTAAPVATGIDSGLAEIFEEFRMEAEGESAAPAEDYETHYNMATAYKEMDLLDEAIREFQAAAALTGSSDGTSRYFQCCNMLGHCFVLKGMPRAAVTWFKKGLDAPGRTPEEYKALQYELGSAFEGMGDLPRAVAAFTEVYGVDVGYRDIAGKLESLQARAASQKKKKKGK